MRNMRKNIVCVLSALALGIALGQIFHGVIPFIMSDLVRLGLLVAFSGIALWLL